MNFFRLVARVYRTLFIYKIYFKKWFLSRAFATYNCWCFACITWREKSGARDLTFLHPPSWGYRTFYARFERCGVGFVAAGCTWATISGTRNVEEESWWLACDTNIWSLLLGNHIRDLLGCNIQRLFRFRVLSHLKKFIATDGTPQFP